MSATLHYQVTPNVYDKKYISRRVSPTVFFLEVALCGLAQALLSDHGNNKRKL